MNNLKKIKKHIKFLNKQIKILKKKNGELNKKHQIQTPKEVKPKAFVPHKESRLDFNMVRKEIEKRNKEEFPQLENALSHIPNPLMKKNFYKVADIIAKDVELEKQKNQLYDKCKLFEEIFAVLDKYVDDVVDVHVKLNEKGINLFEGFKLAKKIKENLKVKHVHGIEYNSKKLKAPQQKELTLVSADKDKPDFNPEIAKEKIESIIKDGKLDNVIKTSKIVKSGIGDIPIENFKEVK
jgi:hypothetical protein